MHEAEVAQSGTPRGVGIRGVPNWEAKRGPTSEGEELAAEEAKPERQVDPSVSRAKFEREVRAYRAQEATYRERGWFLIRAEFPEVLVLMSSPRVQPWGIQYTLRFDFTDYDLLPPSLQFVNPFTLAPLSVGAVLAIFQKREDPKDAGDVEKALAHENGAGGLSPGQAAPPQLLQPLNLVQGHGGDHPAFLCVPGTREYHAHPYHSNDPWLAHRGTGPGSLYYLLDVVWRHGILPFVGYQILFQPRHDPRLIQ